LRDLRLTFALPASYLQKMKRLAGAAGVAIALAATACASGHKLALITTG
jgi:hypothetical protein